MPDAEVAALLSTLGRVRQRLAAQAVELRSQGASDVSDDVLLRADDSTTAARLVVAHVEGALGSVMTTWWMEITWCGDDNWLVERSVSTDGETSHAVEAITLQGFMELRARLLGLLEEVLSIPPQDSDTLEDPDS